MAEKHHYIWLQDCSGSMLMDNAIDHLNEAWLEALTQLEQAPVMISMACFHDAVYWKYRKLTPKQIFASSTPFTAKGETPLGEMLQVLLHELDKEEYQEQELTVILSSDGFPTDDFDEAWHTFYLICKNKKIRCSALALGEDAEDLLGSFCSNGGILKTLEKADNVSALCAAIVKVFQIPLSPPQPEPAPAVAPQQPAAVKQTETKVVAPGSKAQKSDSDDEEAQFIKDCELLSGPEFNSKYQSSGLLLKLRLSNPTQYRRGQAPIFKEGAQGASVLAYRKPLQDRNILAVPNSTIRMNRKIYDNTGIEAFFEVENNLPEGFFKIQLQQPARIARFGEQWNCIAKGKIRLVEERQTGELA